MISQRGASEQGLTLSEIQEIAEQVGLSPEVIDRAAAALDTQPANPPRRSLGMPIEVGKIVTLPSAPSDAEWEQIVAELRSTFRARGRVTSTGALREWSNGNLHVCIEPTAHGYRLRMGTLKGGAAGINAVGVTALVTAAVVFISALLSGGIQGAIAESILLGALGAAALLRNLVRLPGWAEQRKKQMDHVAARVEVIVGP